MIKANPSRFCQTVCNRCDCLQVQSDKGRGLSTYLSTSRQLLTRARHFKLALKRGNTRFAVKLGHNFVFFCIKRVLLDVALPYDQRLETSFSDD